MIEDLRGDESWRTFRIIIMSQHRDWKQKKIEEARAAKT